MNDKKLRFAYRRGKREQLGLDGKLHKVETPVGAGHIFRIVRAPKGGKEEVSARSLCGQGMYDLTGKDGFVRKEVVADLPLCPECVEAWKNDPNSPWAKWTRMVQE